MIPDLSGHIGDIARRLLGEPNKALSTRTTLRFGNHGSIAVEVSGPKRGQWYDHEHEVGGGSWEMLHIIGGFDNGRAEEWLRDHGIETRPKTNGAADASRQRQKQHVIKTYDYHDEDGVLLFKVDRWGPQKTFTQRAPDGNGGWTKGKGAMDGVRRVPYRLPHLVAAKAKANGTPWRVYIAEGEKDVDNLILWWGVTATTNPMGAGKWRPEFNQHFAGSDAVIVADNDDIGRAHVAAVAAELAPIASIVRAVELGGLDEHGDISDWIEAGGSQSDFETLVELIPAFELSGPAGAPIPPRAAQQVHDFPWPIMPDAAYHGLAGDVVRAILPHSEADPAAILIQVLASAGNAIGRGPYYQVEGDRHGPNIFAILVGETAKGRKGVSAGRVRQVMQGADQQWTKERVHSGLSSGEGVIWAVRDPIKEMQRQGKGASAEFVEITVDNGVADKRLYVLEAEFAGALAVMKREGSILSRIMRDAWDRGDLATMTKNNQARATGAHISIVGHITADELRRDLDRTSMANGYANRFLFVCVRRSNVLPFGGALDEETICELGGGIRKALEAARTVNRVEMTDRARGVWREVYPGLSEGEPGLLGAIIGRAEAQVIRLALLYALLSRFAVIDEDHLRAALALWRYCEHSARFIFTDALGDPVADTILRSLRQAGDDGLTRTQISTVFGRNLDAARLALALSTLERTGKATKTVRDTGGRPAEVWVSS
jgi:hypothetical protein